VPDDSLLATLLAAVDAAPTDVPLRLHVAEHPLVADVEGLEENPVAAAKKLLREPRYQDIFPENEV